MADIRVPEVVRKVARLLATDDDTTAVDNVISVALLVFAASLVAPLVHTVLPILPGMTVLPLTAGVLHAVVNQLS